MAVISLALTSLPAGATSIGMGMHFLTVSH